MPLTWIALVFLGAALGWLQSVLLHSRTLRDVLGLVGLGAVGAILGGLLIAPVLAGRVEPTGFSLPALLLSLLGTFLLLGLVALAQRLRRPRPRTSR